MRRGIGLILSLIVMAGIMLTSGNLERAAPLAATSAPGLPPPNPRLLWHYITKESPYTRWQHFPGTTGPTRVDENPHGDWVNVFVNDRAFNSISKPSSPFQMQYGSIMVKENYELNPQNKNSPPTSAQLVSLTVMYKVKGFQTLVGEEEWFWAMYGCTSGDCNGNISTVLTQPWITQMVPGRNYTFEVFKGEVQAGKPWLCVQCHQNAKRSVGRAYGDYVWKLSPFQPSS